jgi:hypothetical protein
MRYRFFEGQLQGSHRRVLVFEQDGKVFRYQMTRAAFNPLPATVLEDVTAESLGFTEDAHSTPVHSTTETDPHKVLLGAATAKS